VRALNFPAFTASTICSHGYTQIIDVGESVRVGGLVVQSGDLLHGDCNGVTGIPIEIAAEVADAAEEFVAAEGHVLDYAKGSGPKSIAELAARRKAMGDALATLRRRLSSGK
jgi:regulator of RNase E activity RraA